MIKCPTYISEAFGIPVYCDLWENKNKDGFTQYAVAYKGETHLSWSDSIKLSLENFIKTNTKIKMLDWKLICLR